ncbi:hypothetical protein [Pseudomonas koreensis]|uniref:hypothetical protein n=1 Tax=Pseudomonas koreensis TaxID=198620 RepID=UPI002077737D|nr:hypothetical protein [Pseudomonas koreensis]MCM8743622.1 hypothetical protein [Pseudomonas koreensis]
MPKRYEVLDRSFINGRLYEPGETVVLEIDSPGSNLKLVSGKDAAAPAPGSGQQNAGYVAARGAAGKFVVKDADGKVLFTGTKAEAEAEADRLNAGGKVKGTEAPAGSGQQNAGGATDGDNTDQPDA